MTKHTPGPWMVAETRHKFDTLIRDRDNDPVASTNFAGYSPKTAAANARLIAAAPLMLAALKKVERLFQSPAFIGVISEASVSDVQCLGTAHAYADVADAIRKAEGETDE